jgi:hypothetical protein
MEGKGGMSVLGPGKYFALTYEDALRWSPSPRKYIITLRKPLRLRSRSEDLAFRRAAGEATGVGFQGPGASGSGEISYPGNLSDRGDQALAEYAKSKGYDAIIVEYEAPYGGNQMVVFDRGAYQEVDTLPPPAASLGEANKALQKVRQLRERGKWLYEEWEPPSSDIDEEQAFWEWASDPQVKREHAQAFGVVAAYLTGERVNTAPAVQRWGDPLGGELAIELPAFGRPGQGGTLTYTPSGWEGTWTLSGIRHPEIDARWAQLRPPGRVELRSR